MTERNGNGGNLTIAIIIAVVVAIVVYFLIDTKPAGEVQTGSTGAVTTNSGVSATSGN